MTIFGDIRDRTLNAKTPKCPNRAVEILLGLLNCFFFGVGTMIAAALDKCKGADVVIGLLQLFLPFVGWIWSIIWGILMIIGRGNH